MLRIFRERAHSTLCKKGWFLGCNCGNFGGSKSKGAEGIAQAGSDLYARTEQTPQESQQYQGSFDIGKLLQQIFQSQQGIGSAPQGYQGAEQQFQGQGALGQQLYNSALNGVQNPEQQYMSTLQPQLQQAQDSINQYYQKRGLLNSGLAIEGMGRAGVDLAIQQAQAMMQNRQQQFSNAFGLEQNAQTLGQNNLGSLANLYSQQQGYGQQSLGRQAAGAQAAAQYQAYPYQAQLGNYYGGQAALQALPGQLVGAAGNVAGGMATGGTGLFK